MSREWHFVKQLLNMDSKTDGGISSKETRGNRNRKQRPLQEIVSYFEPTIRWKVKLHETYLD